MMVIKLKGSHSTGMLPGNTKLQPNKSVSTCSSWGCKNVHTQLRLLKYIYIPLHESPRLYPTKLITWGTSNLIKILYCIDWGFRPVQAQTIYTQNSPVIYVNRQNTPLYRDGHWCPGFKLCQVISIIMLTWLWVKYQQYLINMFIRYWYHMNYIMQQIYCITAIRWNISERSFEGCKVLVFFKSYWQVHLLKTITKHFYWIVYREKCTPLHPIHCFIYKT